MLMWVNCGLPATSPDCPNGLVPSSEVAHDPEVSTICEFDNRRLQALAPSVSECGLTQPTQ